MCSPNRHRGLRVLEVISLLVFLSGATVRLWALDASALQAMVIVEGDEGRGSGFVVKMGGTTYLVTNSHVVRGNRNVKFKNLRNAEIATGPLEIADQVDAVRAAVTGVGHALELEPQADAIKIGDEVVVAGNAEGAGVVREIPGKIVGIGPDRIEVDAEFVPGNSGSPILLKSTGKVIGIATYMRVPRGRTGTKSPFSLNEVRRFGYRLDTVGKWVTPATKDRLSLEGLKLAELENLIGSVTRILDSNAAIVAKWGSSSFVSKDQARQYPAFAALSLAIDDFARDHAAAGNADGKTRAATAFFAKMKSIVADDTRGLAANQFSGFYSTQLKDSLGEVKFFTDWYDGTAMPAYRETWLTSQAMTAARSSSAPLIDPAKFKLVLSDRIAQGEPADHCHHVGYPVEAEPPNMDGLFWVTVEPSGAQHSFQMHKTNLHVHTLVNGTYKVYVEFRGGDKPKMVSNVVEVSYDGAAAGLAGHDANTVPTLPPVAPVEAQTAYTFSAKIAALSPDAVAIAHIRKGTKLTLQYLQGKWKSWGHIPTCNPDDPNTEGGDLNRVVIALPSKEGKGGQALAIVPPNTKEHPFVFEADKDYPMLVLRINDQDNTYAENPGSVEYTVGIDPPGSAAGR